MKSQCPCYSCHRKKLSKDDPECQNCKERWEYVKYMFDPFYKYNGDSFPLNRRRIEKRQRHN